MQVLAQLSNMMECKAKQKLSPSFSMIYIYMNKYKSMNILRERERLSVPPSPKLFLLQDHKISEIEPQVKKS